MVVRYGDENRVGGVFMTKIVCSYFLFAAVYEEARVNILSIVPNRMSERQQMNVMESMSSPCHYFFVAEANKLLDEAPPEDASREDFRFSANSCRAAFGVSPPPSPLLALDVALCFLA